MDPRPPLPPEHTYPDNNKSRHNQENDRATQCLLSKVYIASQALQLSTETRFSAMVLLHRYLSHYHHHHHKSLNHEMIRTIKEGQEEDQEKEPTESDSAAQHSLGTVAAACLFLACKSHNQSRRIRDVMNAMFILHFSNSSTSSTSSNSLSMKAQPPPLDEQYWITKEEIVKTEQHVLRILQFDVTVSQPHKMLVVLWEEQWNLSTNASGAVPVPNQNVRSRVLLKTAWRMLNDAMFYRPALELDCVSLACAALDLAREELEEDSTLQEPSKPIPNDTTSWWEAVGGNKDRVWNAKEILKGATNYLKHAS